MIEGVGAQKAARLEPKKKERNRKESNKEGRKRKVLLNVKGW